MYGDGHSNFIQTRRGIVVVVVVYGSYSWTGRKKKNPPPEEAVVVHVESTQILHGDSRGREHRQNTKHETPPSSSVRFLKYLCSEVPHWF